MSLRTLMKSESVWHQCTSEVTVRLLDKLQ